MRIAVAQFAVVPGDVGANTAVMSRLVREAGEAGARLVVFGELAATDYRLDLIARDPALTLAKDDARLEPIRRACRETGTAAAVSAPVRTAQGRPAISVLVIGPDGELLGRYDKQHLYGRELDVFEPGTTDGRFTLDGVRFALAVCYDNRFPELAARAAADGCRVYVASSALDTDNDSFEKVYPVRARDNGLHVVLGNLISDGDAGPCRGGSGVWGPDGALRADAGPEGGFVLAEVAVG
ncbi:carbon-nitrogen hydrolase family protein [Streptomyces sp. NPDC051940]|uniref:carbon-nitrogen hydrolase family protein n=1 Tax=Streptomyces sp. NPDC051940 TaxID=3155675 RepID=UPI003420734D